MRTMLNGGWLRLRPCHSRERFGRTAPCACVAAIMLWLAAPTARATENLDRGLIVLRTAEGATYIGWRMLASDPPGAAFHVYRSMGGEPAQRLTAEPLRDRTGFTDESANANADARYFVRMVSDDQEAAPSKAVGPADTPAGSSFVRIAFQGDYTAQKVAVADLDGDGACDYIIKQPDVNSDPFQRPGYWKRSEHTYKIEAYRSDGTFLWRHDMGWSIEAGIWYSPFVVYDLDGDGRAEVYAKGGEGDPREPAGHVSSGPEWLLKLDGLTGEIVHRVPWPDRTGYEDYNWTSRNLMGVAYLDGKRPHLLVQRGTYSLIKVDAYDPQLNLVWRWKSTDEKEKYSGSGTHGLHCADVTGDGRDEIILGSAVLGHDGRGLWTNPMHHKLMSHPDICYVGQIDPSTPGLEIFYGFETPQPRDGACLVDARTGKLLWSYDGPTYHLHGQGMVADIVAEHPGQECYVGEQNKSQYWLYTATGERIGSEEINGLSPRPVYWDADPQKELILGNRLAKYKGPSYQEIQGRPIAIVDCLGDWREEVITSLPGELRIYSTTIPAESRRVCLMQDRLYRLGVAHVSMGYFYPPQHSGR